MKIIFDKERLAIIKSTEDSPIRLAERMEAKLQQIGKFCNADSIEYIDHDRFEEYIIKRKSKTLTLYANGNHFDGGFLTVK